jgi:hypothetical protein
MSRMENNKAETLRQGLTEQALASDQLNQVAGGVTTGESLTADIGDAGETTSAARVFRITNVRANAASFAGGSVGSVIPSLY